MKAMKVVLAGCLAAAIAATLWAEVDADYQAAMKGAAGAVGRLKKDIDAKSAEDVAKDAKEVNQNYHKMGMYWKAKSADDALQLCKDGAGAANAIAKAAAAGNMDEAAAQFKTLTGTCAGCHKAHREKAADGSFSIK
jgi:cytochrome c556